MTKSGDFGIFRIRMKDADGSDHAKDKWEKDQVGVWYGSWEAEELEEANKLYEEGNKEHLKYMLDIVKKCDTGGWDHYPNSYFHTCRRFREIKKEDWVLVYFDGTLCLGRLEDDIDVDKHTKEKHHGWFHFRSVIDKKEFKLIELPDSYRLLASAGRGNVHEHNYIYTQMLKVLANSSCAEKVKEHYADLKLEEWLDFLSDTEWESLCLGYLIIEYGYVPSGLLPGGTLSTYDVVGKTRTGKQVMAQCKKSPDSFPVEGTGFLKDYENNDNNNVLWFWCAYGGWGDDSDIKTKKINLVDKPCIVKWMDSDEGKDYRKIVKGDE